MRWRRPAGTIEFAQALDHAFSPDQLAIYAEFLADDVVNEASVLPHMQRLTGRLATRSRSQFVDRRTWRRMAAYEYYREIGLDQQVISIYEFAPGRIDPMTVFRAWGERDFSDRERRLMRLFHAELGRLIGPTLGPAGGLDRLAPRVRETLDCLLRGDSEKQVAARLGISRVTLHQYVTVLYRHFGVSSRAELLSLFVRRPPPPV